ncbi:MAG: NYN domain-containing protein [Eubacteriales bacterium]|nr:NYN domain-containing protein [Eubacteriales bacterium]
MDEVLKDTRLAVLIDADNISHHYVEAMMQEIARYGNPTIKRIYGDWTKPNLSGWKSLLLDYAISPAQQFAYTSGKNATDSAMIIDAMDILYAEKADAFCLVSSDSDFTRLAMRLREAGKTVYGIGEQKTPNAFIAACDRFIYLEILEPEMDDESESCKKNTNGKTKAKGEKHKEQKKSINKIDNKIRRLIAQTVGDVEDESGWAYLGEVGNLLNKKQPSFDSRNYGFAKLTPMIRAMGDYEIDQREGAGNQKHIYIKLKPSAENVKYKVNERSF